MKIAEKAQIPTETSGIRLSASAAEHIKKLVAENNYPEGMYLYVGVKGGGCSGFQWVLDLRDEATAPVDENDEIFSSNGINIVANLQSYVVANLDGTEIDYQESLMGAGFAFNNPNIKHRCGCGSSFSS